MHKFILFLYKKIFFVNNTNGEKNMNKQEYKKIVDKHSPKENKVKNMIIAFLVGGLVGLIGEVLIKVYLMIDGVSQSVAVCLFTALGFFDNWVSKAGAGLFIPISGFAHATTSSALEYKHEGLVMGIGSNIFKLSGSVILYGVVAAYVFGIIRFVFFGG